MSVCILNHAGEILVHRDMPASPETFLKAIAPYREDLVGAVECILTWYWLAALCAHEGLPCVLGHARYMKAIPGGTATPDRIDARKIAVLLRGGLLPQASVYPAALRATRELLRRRVHLTRTRADLLTHIPQTHSQYTLPEIGKKMAYKANRDGVAERFPDPAVPKSGEVDLALRDGDDQLLREVDLTIVQTAQPHDAQTLDRLQAIPGLGKSLR
jgi:transposase